jgi:hypothetical protein
VFLEQHFKVAQCQCTCRDSTPVRLLEGVSKEQAVSAKSALETIGARVSVELI